MRSYNVTEEILNDESVFISRIKFFNLVKATCSDQFKLNIDKVLGHLTMSGNVKDDTVRSLLFGDYMEPDGAKIYDEVADLKQLTKTMEQ